MFSQILGTGVTLIEIIPYNELFKQHLFLDHLYFYKHKKYIIMKIIKGLFEAEI